MEAAAFLLAVSLGSFVVIQNMTKEMQFQTPSCTSEMYGNLESHSSKSHSNAVNFNSPRVHPQPLVTPVDPNLCICNFLSTNVFFQSSWQKTHPNALFLSIAKTTSFSTPAMSLSPFFSSHALLPPLWQRPSAKGFISFCSDCLDFSSLSLHNN